MNANARQDLGLLVLRLGLGLTMTFYGTQKMLGLFGGPGYSAQIGRFTGMGIPPAFAHLEIAGEFFGGLGVLLGAFTPVAAFGVACTMAVATYRNVTAPGAVHAAFTSGSPGDAARVFYSLNLLFAALAVLLLGAGRYSVDEKLFGKRGSSAGKR